MADSIELKQRDQKGEVLVQENVFDIFKNYLQPGSSVSAAQTAAAISQLAPKPSGGETTSDVDDGFFFELWGSVIGVAEQIPHDHPGQDKLVRAIRELTLLPKSGTTAWESSFWVDLPVLGLVFREYLNGPDQSDVEEEQARIDQAWVRFHAFSAKLMGAGVIHFANQPIWMLREALEENHPAKSTALDRSLTTAAMYVEYAGPVLVESLVSNPEPELSDELRRILRGGSLFSGEPGLRPERWAFWTKRFNEEAENTSTKEAKETALRAARLMQVWTEKRLRK
ncbi:hypothetical protein F4818DRAFT_398578 [Hypoxylon cercidicola]|nr:hypothetical protein F4818DRAFT_398578 [Hypoxylon cercidicola]